MVLEKRKFVCVYRDLNPRPYHPQPIRYTDCSAVASPVAFIVAFCTVSRVVAEGHGGYMVDPAQPLFCAILQLIILHSKSPFSDFRVL